MTTGSSARPSPVPPLSRTLVSTGVAGEDFVAPMGEMARLLPGAGSARRFVGHTANTASSRTPIATGSLWITFRFIGFSFFGWERLRQSDSGLLQYKAFHSLNMEVLSMFNAQVFSRLK